MFNLEAEAKVVCVAFISNNVSDCTGISRIFHSLSTNAARGTNHSKLIACNVDNNQL